jgi:para-nitrobenzyl esterase
VNEINSNGNMNDQKTDASDVLKNELNGPVATTKSGRVRGKYLESGILAFLGIPYSAAPVANLRFMPPHPYPAWNEILNASEYGATAPQRATTGPLGDLFPHISIPGDDYLNLNIWTNDLNGKKPVMVFIHGGSFTTGSGAVSGYGGRSFARDGIVLVTINYRLGIDGFLWFGEGMANLGMLDQIAALKWVHDNIVAFGGDPSSVTIFGESAGAMSVGSLLAMPSARGLFHRAILESGAAHHAISADSAKLVAHRIADILGVDHTREAIGKLPIERLLDVQETVAKEVAKKPYEKLWGDVASNGLPFGPVVDGDTLPDYPMGAIKAGASADIDILVGNNAEEAFLLFAPEDKMDRIRKWLIYLVAKRFKLPVFSAARTYFSARPDARAVDQIGDLITDRIYRIPAILLAEAIPSSHVYEFAWRSPAFNNELGASHGVELPFVFDNLENKDWSFMTGGSAPNALAAEIHKAWVDFARSGNPGWDAYTPDNRVVKCFNTESVLLKDPRASTRKFWEGRR